MHTEIAHRDTRMLARKHRAAAMRFPRQREVKVIAWRQENRTPIRGLLISKCGLGKMRRAHDEVLRVAEARRRRAGRRARLGVRAPPIKHDSATYTHDDQMQKIGRSKSG